jgi:hypothetical protein
MSEIYTDYSHWSGESTIDAALEIESDGRFSYDEDWHSYGARSGGYARGVWWEFGGELFFRCDRQDGALYLEWAEGETKKAVKQNDSIDFGRMTLSLRRDAPVKPVETPKPVPAVEEQKPSPAVARLHFSDGSVRERPLQSSLLPGLFTQTYYRLVDDQGSVTHLFEARQSGENADSPVIEYDEIELPPTGESNGFDYTRRTK